MRVLEKSYAAIERRGLQLDIGNGDQLVEVEE